MKKVCYLDQAELQLEDIGRLQRLTAYKYMHIYTMHAKVKFLDFFH